MAAKDWSYACKMFSQAMQHCRENVIYRKSLRACQRKLNAGNRILARIDPIAISEIRFKIKKARESHAWADMDSLAEDGLAMNPWDVQFNLDLGEATRELGFHEVSAFAFETADQCRVSG